MDCKTVTPLRLRMAAIEDHWQEIRPQVEAMKAAQQARDWSPDDFLKKCQDKEAVLFIAPDDEGFAILEARLNRKTGAIQMAILAASGKVADGEAYHPDLIELAKVIDAAEIVTFEHTEGESKEVFHNLEVCSNGQA